MMMQIGVDDEAIRPSDKLLTFKGWLRLQG